jgi:hypothetical protein
MQAELEATAGAQQMLGGGAQNAEGQPGGMASGAGTGGSPETAGIQRRAQPGSQMPGNM